MKKNYKSIKEHNSVNKLNLIHKYKTAVHLLQLQKCQQIIIVDRLD